MIYFNIEKHRNHRHYHIAVIELVVSYYHDSCALSFLVVVSVAMISIASNSIIMCTVIIGSSISILVICRVSVLLSLCIGNRW